MIWQVYCSVQAQRQHITCQNNMSGQYDGVKPNSSPIPRVVFMATAQKRMPQAPQTVAKLTFALDVCQEKARLN